MRPSELTVVKVGGSLLDWSELRHRLAAFLDARRTRVPSERIVLIAGGGSAADMIRALDRIHGLGDERAHELALRALDLTAGILAELVQGSVVVDRIAALENAWNTGAVPVVAPRLCIDELAQSGRTPLQASWDVTSDAIAAWIADALGASRLILLKSASLPDGCTLGDAAQRGFVDPEFPAMAKSLARVEYLNLRDRSLEPRVLS